MGTVKEEDDSYHLDNERYKMLEGDLKSQSSQLRLLQLHSRHLGMKIGSCHLYTALTHQDSQWKGPYTE